MTTLIVGDIITDILAVHSGQIAVDSDTPAQVTIAGGGSAANTAAWLAFLGSPVEFVGAAGRDAAGDDRVAELVGGGVGCSYVLRTTEEPTGSVIVLTDGIHRTMLTDRGANRALRPSDVDNALDQLSDVNHLHLSAYLLLDPQSRATALATLASAAKRGISTSVDAASAEPLRRVGPANLLTWIRAVDLVFANLDEARVLAAALPLGETKLSTQETATLLAQSTGAAVVVKLGSAGALWADGSRTRQVPAHPATVVDTTGAGDAFAAGFLAVHVAGGSVDAALAQAVRLGAQAVSTVGGRPTASRNP